MFLTNTFGCPIWLLILIGFFILFLIAAMGFFAWKWIKFFLLDVVIFLDKNDRWSISYTTLSGKQDFSKNNGLYHLNPDAGLLNQRGKALFVFTENKSAPLKITHDTVKWFDAHSVKAFVQNKIAQQIVKPTDKLVDMLILVGAIGGIIAGLASIVILLIQTGVLKGVAGV